MKIGLVGAGFVGRTAADAVVMTGVTNVTLSRPRVLGTGSVVTDLQPELDQHEVDGLRRSADPANKTPTPSPPGQARTAEATMQQPSASVKRGQES
ncbi:MAG: hypothetical protein EA405_06525 [Rhodospirillales bacterium]|nr:MAG: hypothetical protein EA405_06525 [Rhodospirillales bacterium]